MGYMYQQALEVENECLRAQIKEIIMRQADNFQKLKDAGFKILRSDDTPSPRIKEWESDSAWRTLEKFDTKAARDRQLESLLKDPRIITG